MNVIFFIAILFSLTACFTSVNLKNQYCYNIQYHPDKLDYDTAMIRLQRTVVFDTTAVLLHGNITDLNSNVAIQNATVTIFNSQEKYSETTDANGEFVFFKNLPSGKWTLKIKHSEFYYLLFYDITLSGGQWFDFKLRHY